MNSANPIAGVEGKVFLRDGSEAYTEASYQYATSSYLYDGPLSMQPAVIIYAKNESDVKLVLKYAKAKGIAVAVRTGGHQYSGASSTTGITLSYLNLGDLLLTFPGFRGEYPA